MPDQRRQFRVLYRDFLFRAVDLEILSTHGDVQKLLGQLAAILAAVSFVLTLLLAPRYAREPLTKTQLLIAACRDEEFLIAVSSGVVGLFAVMSWNAVCPDRRDSLVLGPLPVRMRTIFAAKVSAIAVALALSIVTVNIFTGFIFPITLTPPGGFFLRS